MILRSTVLRVVVAVVVRLSNLILVAKVCIELLQYSDVPERCNYTASAQRKSKVQFILSVVSDGPDPILNCVSQFCVSFLRATIAFALVVISSVSTTRCCNHLHVAVLPLSYPQLSC